MAGRKRRFRVQPRFFLLIMIAVGVLVGVVLVMNKLGEDGDTAALPSNMPTATPSATATPHPALPDGVTVVRGESANPSNLGFSSEIRIGGNNVDTYSRTDAISFGRDGEYSTLPGITTFGGNNYRNRFAYGTAVLSQKRLNKSWEFAVGAIGNWTGTGWTGQPLIVEWPAEVRAVLGIKDNFKTAESFIEVIYPCMDGNIYFFDLESGTQSRDPIATGVVLKGTACIDPRGYPILYCGQGIAVTDPESKMDKAYIRVFSLITNQEIAKFGGYDYFSTRKWQAYDGSPMIVNDTIVYGGENGVLYSTKLNTAFDAAAGTVAISPNELVKYRYNASGYSKDDAQGARWYGTESSVAAFRNFAFFTDNGGRLQCVDLNTLQLKYAVDVGNSADATVVLEESYDDNTVYLYTASQATMSDAGMGDGYGYSYMKKINGMTGAVVWEKKWICSTGDAGGSGGVVATPHVGSGFISNLVIYSMTLASRSQNESASPSTTPEATEQPSTAQASTSFGGRIVAYDKTSGEIAWTVEQTDDYWSSPVVVYDEQGRGYLIQCDRGGYVKLYDAATGTELYSIDLGSRIDSTPAVFNGYIVVGTRGKGGSGESAKIVCLKLT